MRVAVYGQRARFVCALALARLPAEQVRASEGCLSCWISAREWEGRLPAGQVRVGATIGGAGWRRAWRTLWLKDVALICSPPAAVSLPSNSSCADFPGRLFAVCMLNRGVGTVLRRALSSGTGGESVPPLSNSLPKRVLGLFTPEVGIVIGAFAASVGGTVYINNLEHRHDAKMAALEARMYSVKEHVDSEVKGVKEQVREHVDSEVKGIKEQVRVQVNSVKEHVDSEVKGVKELTHAEVAGIQQIVDKNAENHVLKLMKGYKLT
jgi:hypothetical protein